MNADRKTMHAQPTDPWVAVHALSEYLYCPRAAVLATEDDEALEAPQEPRRADYVPLYFSEQPIIEALQRATPRLMLALTVALIAGLAAVVFAWIGKYVYVVATALVELVTIPQVVKAFSEVRELRSQWAAFQDARPRSPTPDLQDDAFVDWWELRRDGFEAIQYRDVLSDERLKLAGRPWRVLRRGNLRIPVFRPKNADQKLRIQHRARAAAYCHLLESCEGAQSPYAVVLFRRSYSGVAIPNSPRARKPFHQALAGLREMLARNCEPPPPDDLRCCQRCPFGYPVVHRPGANREQGQGRITACRRCRRR